MIYDLINIIPPGNTGPTPNLLEVAYEIYYCGIIKNIDLTAAMLYEITIDKERVLVSKVIFYGAIFLNKYY